MVGTWKNFALDKRLGKGGMAYVYLVRRKENGIERQYALKIINIPDVKQIDNIKLRFKNEINNHKEIKSKYVVRLYESSFDVPEQLSDKKNEMYMLLEYVDGKSIQEKIKQKGRIKDREAVDYTIKLCFGFAEIHNNGIIHRDIKSSNILITNDGDPKIIDFGISLSKDSSRVTKEHSVIGTLPYMAPELVKESAQPSIQSDIYALGSLLYEMLTGTVPFVSSKKDRKELVGIIKTVKFPDVRKVISPISNGLYNCILRATAPNPNKRYRTMNEFADDLKTCLSDKRVSEPDLDLNSLKSKKKITDVVSSKTFIIVSVVIIICILIIVGTGLLWGLQ